MYKCFIGIIICFFIIIIPKIKNSNTFYNDKSHEQEPKSTNISEYLSTWDFSNIPEEIINNSESTEDILNILSTRKYRTCKASVLYHPLKNMFYFRNPSITKKGRGSGSLKEYISIKCKSFISRSVSYRQRFYIPFKDVEHILENNDDSILMEGLHEITDIRYGLEMSLFPVKFYKALHNPESNYINQKELLCYDSIKVLGIDKSNFDYFILSAMDKHKIVYCDSNDVTKNYNLNLNHFIRYSSYCDEFCAEDFIYFSNDLIKCKCDFFSYVEDMKKNKNYIANNNNTENCQYSRKLDRYEIFANPYEIAEKITKYEEENKSYYRYYLHLIIILFTFQILYAFYFTTKNNVFIRFTIIVYIILAIIVYIPHRIKINPFDAIKLFEVVSDLYPMLLLVFISCDQNTKQYDILKLSFMIFINSMDYILKETYINEIELVLRLVFIASSFVVSNTLEGGYLQFYNTNIRLKNAMEFLSRFFLYMIEHNMMTDISVPLFIILGRPKESSIYTDHILFQSNYLKLKPNFDKLYENWFMEALNFIKFKNMLMFLKFTKYFIVTILLTIFIIPKEVQRILNYLKILKFNKIFNEFILIGLKIGSNTNYTNNILLNKIHIPILFSVLFSNILITKDQLKIFIFHFSVGFLMKILFEKDTKKIKINLNRNSIESASGSPLINNLNN